MNRRKKNSQRTAKEDHLSISSSRRPNFWDSYWFGPVSPIRPYLLIKTVLILLAFDLWLLRISRGSRYGLDGFNVAHFQWLDTIQPLPNPDLYVGLVLATGLLALVCALTSAGRWLLALVALLYTYTWAMSMLDGFQHHYFLSLVLTAFVFFPRVSVHDLYSHGAAAAQSKQEAGPLNPGKTRVASWGYVLLGVNMAVVYAFTALTKVSETGFFTGQVIQRLTRKEGFFSPIEAWFTRLGVSSELFWGALALSVIGLEVFLAIVYLLAVKQDENHDRWLRLLTGSAYVMAVSFHEIGNELILSLRIGWFSYYMIALACVYLLPASFLWIVGLALTWPARQLAALKRSILSILDTRLPKIKNSLIAMGGLSIGGMTVLVGFALDLPGAFISGLIVGGILAGGCLAAVALDCPQDALRYAGATALATLLMWLTATQSMMRFDYYEQVGFNYQRRGNLEASIAAYEKAIQYVPPGRRRNVKNQ